MIASPLIPATNRIQREITVLRAAAARSGVDLSWQIDCLTSALGDFGLASHFEGYILGATDFGESEGGARLNWAAHHRDNQQAIAAESVAQIAAAR